MPRRSKTRRATHVRAAASGRRTSPTEAMLLLLSVVLFVYAAYATSRYLALDSMLAGARVIHPLIKLVIGAPVANTTGMIHVPLNQTFCPQNKTINQTAAAYNSYLYYTNAAPMQEFRYSLIYNASNRRIVRAVVMPPFKLVSFSDAIQARADCAGYPTSFGNATMIIQAPAAPSFGPFYAVMYSESK